MQIELDSWRDGSLVHETLTAIDRWAVQAAHKVALKDHSTVVVLEQQPTAISSRKAGVGAVCWDGAFVLSAYLAGLQPSSTWSNRSVLELGAGLGLVGLYLGKLQADVVLTDKRAVIPLLLHNIMLNRDGNDSFRVTATALEWGPEGCSYRLPSITDCNFDVIVAADCIYIDQDGQTPSVGGLIQTCSLYASRSTDCFIAFECRCDALRTTFLGHATKAFRNVRLLQQDSLPVGFKADHVELYCLTCKVANGRLLILAGPLQTADGCTLAAWSEPSPPTLL